MSVATGCGFKEIYRFPNTTYPYSSCICTFWQQHPYFFVHFLNVFRSYVHICVSLAMQVFNMLEYVCHCIMNTSIYFQCIHRGHGIALVHT